MGGDRRFELAAAVGSALVLGAGVVFFGWPAFTVLAFYWIENVVIGVFTLLRLLVAAARAGQFAEGVVLSAFFTAHYGLFCLGHAFLIVTVFGGEPVGDQLLFGPAKLLIARVASDSIGILALLAIVVGAAADLSRWLGDAQAADRADLHSAMAAPYRRIVVLHVVLLGGAFLLQLLHAPALAALMLIGAKLVSDLLRLRRQPAAAARTAA